MANKYAGTQTEKNLMTAFAGESEARNKYTYFASKAKKEGYEQIAALFLATADNEKEHAKLWFKELGLLGDTAENLASAAAGENYEPNVLCYAESEDGIHWKKSRINPIFVKDKNNFYEKDRVGGCQVIKTEDMGYVMFYIGYEDIHTARICAARSADGITRWERCPLNPLVQPTGEGWDADATYKPSLLWDEENCRWMLWYNGRAARVEAIGLATKAGRELF